AALADADVATWYGNYRRSHGGSDFAPLHLQRVVAIGCVLREGTTLRVWSLGEVSDPEPELIRRFFDGIDRYTPQLVSWNGGAFEVPHWRDFRDAWDRAGDACESAGVGASPAG